MKPISKKSAFLAFSTPFAFNMIIRTPSPAFSVSVILRNTINLFEVPTNGQNLTTRTVKSLDRKWVYAAHSTVWSSVANSFTIP